MRWVVIDSAREILAEEEGAVRRGLGEYRKNGSEEAVYKETVLSVYHWRLPDVCILDKKCKTYYNDVRINVNIV